MNFNINSWTKNDFITFVLIHASFADKLIQEDEKWIMTKFASIERYYQILEFYRNNSTEQNQEIIKQLKNKFITTERTKDELVNQIHKLLKSDKQYSEIEKEVETAIEALLSD